MSTIRCPECKMVNWATALNCKRCARLFQTAETIVAAQTTVAAQATVSVQPQPVAETFVQPSPDYSQNYNQSAFQPEISWGNQQNKQNYNQQYNQPYNQNYGQNYYQPQLPAANQKIGLAVTAMIFGILAIATTIFLIGVLLAPIGLILGIVALVKANKKPQQYGGKGFAIAGIATSGLVALFIPIIVAIAIPNLMAAKRAANEGSTISAIRTLADAETTYRTTFGKGTCADLQTLQKNNLIDASVAKGEKNGYRFMIINYPLGGCEITATPNSTSDGDRSFYYSTDDELIRAARKNGKPADKSDKLLGDKSEDSFTALPQGVKPNEGAAISTLRTLQGAQLTYVATAGAGECCADFPTLASQGLIKPDLADGEDMGYRFMYKKAGQRDSFEITATPVSAASGSRSFFISPLDGLRGSAKNGLPADKKDPPVE